MAFKFMKQANLVNLIIFISFYVKSEIQKFAGKYKMVFVPFNLINVS